MKPRTVVLSALLLSVAALGVGRMFPRKNAADDTPEWMKQAAGPSPGTVKLLKRMQADFAEDNLYGAPRETADDLADSKSQRPVLFQNQIVPRAAVALYENNEELKVIKSPKANTSAEAEDIDFWVGKVPVAKFWERWLDTIARSPEYANVPLSRTYEKWIGTPKAPPPPITPPTSEPAEEITGLTGYMTSTPAPSQDDLMQQLAEARAEYVKFAAETPAKLEALPPSQSLQPVLFRDKIVPQAAQTLYEDNEQLKLLKSPRADYSVQAQDPDYWVPKVQPSAFWNTRMKVAAAAKVSSPSNGSKTKPGTAPRAEPKSKELGGLTGYMTSMPKGGDGQPSAAPAKPSAADAASKLQEVAMQRGAFEQQRRTLLDRKAALTVEALQLQMVKRDLAADFESYNARLAAYNIEVAKIKTQRSKTDLRNPVAVAVFNAKQDKSEEKKRVLDEEAKELNKRQEDLIEKIKPLAEEEKAIEAQTPELTEKINALIKEFVALQAQLFGAQR